MIFHFMFVHYTFSSVWVADWPPFGKKLPDRLAICSHCILSICNIYLFISRLGFKSGICLLIALVPVHCFSITFIWVKSFIGCMITADLSLCFRTCKTKVFSWRCSFVHDE